VTAFGFSIPRARRSLISAALLASIAFAPAATQQERRSSECQPAGRIAALPQLPEASGIAVSRSVPGRLWAHNDSGPVLFALDTRGALTGRFALSDLKLDDWEAVAVGPCPDGSCVYVADIGDNNANRKRITIYRFPEPSGSEGTVTVKDAFHATYPDGPQDAEAFFVMPDGGLFIVTKGETGAVTMYRFPRELKSGATHQLERVGKPRGSAKLPQNERITDGAASANGESIVLRTSDTLTFHRSADLLAGNWTAMRTVDLKPIREPQGEGVAVGADGTVYLVGEGAAAGSFARLTCTVPARM
jgi:hypothetical protein